VDFASRTRLGETDSNTASHDVWQIQPHIPLSEIAEEREEFGSEFGAANSLDTSLLGDLIFSVGASHRRDLKVGLPVIAAEPIPDNAVPGTSLLVQTSCQ
jgi:hypothetical protein